MTVSLGKMVLFPFLSLFPVVLNYLRTQDKIIIFKDYVFGFIFHFACFCLFVFYRTQICFYLFVVLFCFLFVCFLLFIIFSSASANRRFFIILFCLAYLLGTGTDFFLFFFLYGFPFFLMVSRGPPTERKIQRSCQPYSPK